MQRNLSLAKNEAHEAKETLSGAQQKLAGAEQELEETRSKAHAESREAATRIKELKVSQLKSRSESEMGKSRDTAGSFCFCVCSERAKFAGHCGRRLSQHSTKQLYLDLWVRIHPQKERRSSLAIVLGHIWMTKELFMNIEKPTPG